MAVMKREQARIMVAAVVVAHRLMGASVREVLAVMVVLVLQQPSFQVL
jgi:hypothetical protein